MKKLLIGTLSAALVLSTAAMAVAAPAVTVNGEVNSGWNFKDKQSATGGQATINAAVNDNVSLTSEFTFGNFENGFKAVGLDQVNSSEVGAMDNYSVNVKTAVGTIQAGYLQIGTGEKIDQLDTQIFNVGKWYKGSNLVYSNQLTKNVNAKLAYDYEVKAKGAMVDYATDKYSVGLAYGDPGDVNTYDPSYGVNASYNLAKDAVVYGQYAIKSNTASGDALAVVGAKYDAGKGFWGEAEYGQLENDKKDSMIEAGYYIQPNANFFVRNRKTADLSKTYAILSVNF